MVQQGAITIRGLLVTVMFSFGVTIVDVMVQRLRTWLRNRTPNPSQEPQVTHTLPSGSIVAVEEKAQREPVAGCCLISAAPGSELEMRL